MELIWALSLFPECFLALFGCRRKTGIDYVFLADLLTYHAASMYRGYEIVSAASFRVTRNSNLYLEEEETRNLLESVRTELHRRRKGDAVRLEIDANAKC